MGDGRLIYNKIINLCQYYLSKCNSKKEIIEFRKQYEVIFDTFRNVVSEDCMFCKQSGEIIKLGIYNIFPVESDGSLYYIIEKDILKTENVKEFWFKSSRRDLVEVNGIVSARFLR